MPETETLAFPGEQNQLFLSNGNGTRHNPTAALLEVPDFTHSASVGDVYGNGTRYIVVGNVPYRHLQHPGHRRELRRTDGHDRQPPDQQPGGWELQVLVNQGGRNLVDATTTYLHDPVSRTSGPPSAASAESQYGEQFSNVADVNGDGHMDFTLDARGSTSSPATFLVAYTTRPRAPSPLSRCLMWPARPSVACPFHAVHHLAGRLGICACVRVGR